MDTAEAWAEHARPGVQGALSGEGRRARHLQSHQSRASTPGSAVQAAQRGPGAFCNEPATWLDRDL